MSTYLDMTILPREHSYERKTQDDEATYAQQDSSHDPVQGYHTGSLIQTSFTAFSTSETDKPMWIGVE